MTIILKRTKSLAIQELDQWLDKLGKFNKRSFLNLNKEQIRGALIKASERQIYAFMHIVRKSYDLGAHESSKVNYKSGAKK